MWTQLLVMDFLIKLGGNSLRFMNFTGTRVNFLFYTVIMFNTVCEACL